MVSLTRSIRHSLGRITESLIERIASRIESKILNIAVIRRLDSLLWEHYERKAACSVNPLLKAGRKYYSQNDEDGILLEVLRRINLGRGVFVEIGVGNGCENNTIILLMSGWKGVWIGAEELAFSVFTSSKLCFRKCLVNTSNVTSEVSLGLISMKLSMQSVDVLSIDIDSFDYQICKQLMMDSIYPKVIIVEYNGKFPPPIKFIYPVDEPWDGSDFSGCSLQSWIELLGQYQYTLVCCNVTGVNAFFVQNKYLDAFADVPKDVTEIFMPPDYNWFVSSGHAVSARSIASFL